MLNQAEKKTLQEIVFSLEGSELNNNTFNELTEYVFTSSNSFLELQSFLYNIEEEEFVSHFKTKTESSLIHGFLYFLNHQLERSEEILSPIKNHSLWASYWLIKIHKNLKNWDKALDIAESAKKRFPDSLELEWIILDIWILTGWEKESEQLLLKLCEKYPEDSMCYFYKGELAEFKGQYNEAVDFYEKSLELNNDNIKPLFRLGFLHSLYGETEDAITYYNRCIELSPVYVNALINLGLLYEDINDFNAACSCFSTVLEFYPNHPRAKLYLADSEASTSMCYDKHHEKEVTRQNRILKIPVTDFELSVRSRNCLNKMHIESLGDLIMKTEAELLSYKNFGETSLYEVKTILKNNNLRLGQGLGKEGKEAEQAPDEIEKGLDPELLSRPIEFLNLSIRSRRCMERLAIRTIKDLIYKNEVELISSKNFGVTSLNEIKKKLDEVGLKLRE